MAKKKRAKSIKKAGEPEERYCALCGQTFSSIENVSLCPDCKSEAEADEFEPKDPLDEDEASLDDLDDLEDDDGIDDEVDPLD